MRDEFRQAVKFAREFIQEHPEKTDEVMDLLDLCQSEMAEEGASPQHELDLFINDCKQLLENVEG